MNRRKSERGRVRFVFHIAAIKPREKILNISNSVQLPAESKINKIIEKDNMYAEGWVRVQVKDFLLIILLYYYIWDLQIELNVTTVEPDLNRL